MAARPSESLVKLPCERAGRGQCPLVKRSLYEALGLDAAVRKLAYREPWSRHW
ncbi:MAG: hypothetical protein ABI865_03440 [Nitrosospira sp.]